MRVLRIAVGGFRSIAFSPIGHLMATGHEGGMIRLWDPRSATEVANATTRMQSITHLFFSAAGTDLFASHWGNIFHWRIESDGERMQLVPGRQLPSREGGAELALPLAGVLSGRAIAVSPDDRYLMGGSGGFPIVHFWSLQDESSYIRCIDHAGDGISQLIVRPDGQQVATVAGYSGVVQLWDYQGGTQLTIPERDRRVQHPLERAKLSLVHSAMISNLVYSPDSRSIATIAGRTLRVWDAERGSLRFQATVAGTELRGLAYTITGRRIAAGANDRDIRVWDAETGEERNRYTFDIGKIAQIAFSGDGTIGAAGGRTRKLIIWDMEDE